MTMATEVVPRDMFQSLIGRLQTRLKRAGGSSTDMFQSLIGRLQTYDDEAPKLKGA